MKRKTKIRVIQLVYIGDNGIYYENEDLLSFIRDMGYYIYEDPTHEDYLIISDQKVTYGNFKKRFGSKGDLSWIDLEWWNKKTPFNELLTKELNKVII